MRTLKFRAWDGEKMISPDYINRNGVALWMENSIPETSKTLMQFTGLKDSEGKEIYEGDIVKTSAETDRSNIEVISFNNGNWSYSYDLDEYGTEPDKAWKIIGNVHENPELLNKEKDNEQQT